MKNKKPKTYTDEFKKTSAQLAFESDKSLKQTAIDLGLTPSTLHSWVKKYHRDPTTKDKTSKSLVELELQKLKKEFLIVQQERDILKKASAYFASQMR
jgi:transposase